MYLGGCTRSTWLCLERILKKFSERKKKESKGKAIKWLFLIYFVVKLFHKYSFCRNEHFYRERISMESYE